MKAYHHVQL